MGLTPKKSLGQHFLRDPAVIAAIVAALPAEPEALVEIGPGPGALTQPLLAQRRPLWLVEKDRRAAATWRDKAHAGVTVIEGDAMEPAWIAMLPPGHYGVVGNLPYNVATVILRQVLAHHDRFPWAVLMFQREVATRITAVGGADGGPMGLLAQSVYRVTRVIDAGPGAFRPPPRVHSRVLKFERLAAPLPATAVAPAWALLLRLFQRRRALLDKALATAAGVTREQARAWMREHDLREGARPDHLLPRHVPALLAYCGTAP